MEPRRADLKVPSITLCFDLNDCRRDRDRFGETGRTIRAEFVECLIVKPSDNGDGNRLLRRPPDMLSGAAFPWLIWASDLEFDSVELPRPNIERAIEAIHSVAKRISENCTEIIQEAPREVQVEIAIFSIENMYQSNYGRQCKLTSTSQLKKILKGPLDPAKALSGLSYLAKIRD